MFDRMQGRLALAKLRPTFGIDRNLDERRDGQRIRSIPPTKHNASSSRCRREHQRARLTEMQSDTLHGCLTGDGATCTRQQRPRRR